jgi:hypothetical protein
VGRSRIAVEVLQGDERGGRGGILVVDTKYEGCGVERKDVEVVRVLQI